MNIILKVEWGRGDPVEVEMPAATTGKYAFARVIEALGGDPRETQGFLAPVIDGDLDITKALGDDDVVADWDGVTVMAVVTRA